MESNELVVLGQQAQQEIAPVVGNAQMVADAIKDSDSYHKAAQYLQMIKSSRKRVAEILDPFVQAAHGAWKRAVAERNKYDEPLNAAEDIVKPAMATWWTAEQARIQAEQRRLEAEARKREEEQRLAEAVHAEENGDQNAAEAILDKPMNVAPVVLPQAPRPGGISMRDEWKFEVNNLMELAKAVVAGKIPITAIQANEKFLGQQARSLKGEMKYPGVRVWSVKNISSGTGRAA